VDDLFYVFDKADDIKITFQLFKSIHKKNFNSQMSLSTKIKLPFWMFSVHITTTNKGIEIKETHLHWLVHEVGKLSVRYKQNSVFTLLDHSYKICNSYSYS